LEVDLLSFLLSVVFVSLSGVMMPGPVFAVTVAKGYRSKVAGVLIALGHGAIEFPLMFLIYFGFTQFFTSTVRRIIGFIGGLILLYMGLQMFKTVKNPTDGVTEESKHGSFVAGLLTTCTNPYFFLWWITVGATLIMNSMIFGFLGFLMLATAHWLCDLSWDSFVGFMVFKSKSFWNKKVRQIVFGFCFVTLICFGVWFIISALF